MKAKGVFIPGNTPSSKNTKSMVFHNKDGSKRDKPILLSSATTAKYIKATKLAWLENKEVFHHLVGDSPLPLVVGFHFYRKTKREYDWINALQVVQDLMVEYGWIKDDSVSYLIPVPFKMKGSYSTHNKDNPGTWIVPITKQVLKDLNGNLDE